MANTKKKVPVLLFARVSSDDQDYRYQIRELQEYCKQNNYQIVETIANNISGRAGNKRPDLDKLFDLAKKKTFNKVVITSIERLGRDAKMIRKTIDELHTRGISIVFKSQGFESLVDGEENFIINIIISIYSEMAQEDNRLRSQKIRSGLAHAKKTNPNFTIGRPKGDVKTPAELVKEYSKLAKSLRNGFSLVQCMKLHSVSKNTVIKVKKALSAV